MKVIAHRGASGERPENTMSAYRLAVAQRADMIEIDLHRTRDGAIPITHDATLEHLGGRGEIADATLAEVRALDAGGGERVPLLHEVLDELAPQIPFNLELKIGARGSYAGLEAATLAEVNRRGLLAQTLFSSFYDDVLAELRRQSAAARLALLISRNSATSWVQRARSLRAEALNPELAQVTPELVHAAHGEGLAVYVFTVDPEDQMRRMRDLGVDGLFTNYPARLRRILQSG
ncbi:MAG: glycerophosphodiester phosphodiesterase [Deltaproteobacteria bacterium]|nr:glycerophosphodiester phosphodiesterase [Deltaproteobacteria bacterium]